MHYILYIICIYMIYYILDIMYYILYIIYYILYRRTNTIFSAFDNVCALGWSDSLGFWRGPRLQNRPFGSRDLERGSLLSHFGIRNCFASHLSCICSLKGVPRATLERFWVDLGMPGHRKSMLFPKENNDFQEIGFCDLKCLKCLPDVPHWSRKAPRGSPCGAQERPESPPKRFQELPFTILEHPKCFRIAYAGPKCIQKLSNSLPRAILQRFSSCFGRFLTDFLWIWTLISITSCWPNVGCNLLCFSSDLSMQWYFSSSEQLVNYILYIIYYILYIIYYIR